jgi:hypothetical protein
MSWVPIPEYEIYWQTEGQSLRDQYKNLNKEFPDAEGSKTQVYKRKENNVDGRAI